MPTPLLRPLAPALGLLLTAALAGCSGGGPAGSGSESAVAAPIYQQKCQNCHGKDGGGGGAPALTAASKPEADLRKVIENGGKKMPAFKSQLTPEQINVLVKYVQGLGKA